jgi:hypothetical protein
MTSQVNDQLTNYDPGFPVAGQDNDTVKFRLIQNLQAYKIIQLKLMLILTLMVVL